MNTEQRKLMAELGQHSRSAVFEWGRAIPFAQSLHDQGVIDINTMRDRSTGRLVKTIIREMGRLRETDDTAEAWPAAAIAKVYRYLRDKPLPDVKSTVRQLVQTTSAASPHRRQRDQPPTWLV